MTAKTALDALRQEIDAIDDAIHDLLMKRTQVVAQIGKAKGHAKTGGNPLRPAREAEVLRRLVRRHKGGFPKAVLVRLWRELMGGFTAMQGSFSLAVLGDAGGCDMAGLARDHFGTASPMKVMATARRVIDAVRKNEASIGVLPLPRRDDDDPWWPHLVSIDPLAPKVIARLPFAPSTPGDAAIDAFAISPLAQEETGNDRCLFVVEADQDIRLTGFARALKKAGLTAVTTAVWHDDTKPEQWLYLAEIDGCISPEGSAAARLMEAMDGAATRIVPLGGYAVPLSASDMKNEKS